MDLKQLGLEAHPKQRSKVGMHRSTGNRTETASNSLRIVQIADISNSR